MEHVKTSKNPVWGEHEVIENENIEDIAEKYSMLPSELRKINKLSRSLVYTGQKLRVNCSQNIEPNQDNKNYNLKNVDIEEKLKMTHLAEKCSIHYYSKRFTNKNGVVSGKMYISPNTFTFYPNRTDPLVIENFQEKYSLKVPLKDIMFVNLYPEIEEISETARHCDECSVSNLKRFSSSPTPNTTGKFRYQSRNKQIYNSKNSPFPCTGTSKSTQKFFSKTFDVMGKVSSSGSETINYISTFNPFSNKVKDGSLKSTVKNGSKNYNYSYLTFDSNENVKTMLNKPIHQHLKYNIEETPEKINFIRIRTITEMPDERCLEAFNYHEHFREYWFAINELRSGEIICKLNTFLNKDVAENVTSIMNKNLDFDQYNIIENQSDSKSLFHFCDCPINMKEKNLFGVYEIPETAEEKNSILPITITSDSQVTNISLEPDINFYEYGDESSILDEAEFSQVSNYYPRRTIGSMLKMVYTSEKLGFCMNTLYNRAKSDENQHPMLLLIQDNYKNKFGAFLSKPLVVNSQFYGSCENWLFTFYPEFNVYGVSGINNYYVKSDFNSIAIGSSCGHHGLWLNRELYRGRSQPCTTFNNTCLTEDEDFTVSTLELWIFS
ncbi:Oxidation resistance protein 1 [Intoshia linei]|uniref:Oxidation resistance protein 1 n=1 Tax=Intoshia linei TaxID=1819745 RepID=A0A177BAG2_9BILA|nr:Oxidation resistance protein 1 [Intoshia linei]